MMEYVISTLALIGGVFVMTLLFLLFTVILDKLKSKG